MMMKQKSSPDYELYSAIIFKYRNELLNIWSIFGKNHIAICGLHSVALLLASIQMIFSIRELFQKNARFF